VLQELATLGPHMHDDGDSRCPARLPVAAGQR